MDIFLIFIFVHMYDELIIMFIKVTTKQHQNMN